MLQVLLGFVPNVIMNPNHDNTLFHSFERETSNHFSVLSDSSIASLNSPTITSPIVPTATSSPIRPKKQKIIKQNWRTMILNCQSLHGKLPQFHSAVDYYNPDSIVGCESWLDSCIHNSEIFQQTYNVYRKDRNLEGGGVFLTLKAEYISSSVNTEVDNCDVVWARVHLINEKPMYFGSFYRKPNSGNPPMDN